MTFRQNSNKHTHFLRLSRQVLLELDIPLRTMELDAWIYLLEHGSCFYTNWTIDKLNRQQLLRLLELVNSYGGNYSNVLRTQIEYKLGGCDEK